MAETAFENVRKRYPDGFEAVKAMSLQVDASEIKLFDPGSGAAIR